jgi:hypothetical protein
MARDDAAAARESSRLVGMFMRMRGGHGARTWPFALRVYGESLCSTSAWCLMFHATCCVDHPDASADAEIRVVIRWSLW